MASGRLGNADLAATTNTKVYTVPVGKVSTINAGFVNRSSVQVKVRMAIASTDVPTNAEYVEYDAPIPANGVLERSGIVCGENEKIVCYASSTGISVRIHGFEEVV
ncbi:hypothetical protein [Sulfuricurvum sp.]|uniref:hypothetical protein n=1 Tax=Sulfuricurvum sp. TaxID=2025608 RepID=UPI002606319A|nr:hypothetical protein [Sulfuricurvum sp.]MDD2267014.1 hypothetical protein [Sulfuricurvum sp.]MDD2782630.1 hypothetical protein [Sulfuricurvum sp.]